MGIEERLMAILDKLGELRDIKGAAIANTEGFVIASRFFTPEFHEEKFAGMVSEAVAYSKRLLAEAGAGQMVSGILEGDKGKIALVVIGDFIIVILGGTELNLGLTRALLQESARDLAQAS